MKKDNKFSLVLLTIERHITQYREVLFYKLKDGVNGSFLALIKDLYAKTRCAVKINGKRNEIHNLLLI